MVILQLGASSVDLWSFHLTSHIKHFYASFLAKLFLKMGCGMSREDREGKARNEEIENQLKRDKMMQRNEIKMLLLGMAFSG